MTDKPIIAVIGGSGLCQQDIFPTIDRIRPTTAYGDISDDISICTYPGATSTTGYLAFLPRHGKDHTLAPHQIPYRANLSALYALGVRQIIATCISGSLRRRIKPGDLVIPDQFIDFTTGRDTPAPTELVHVPMAEPYCPRLRTVAAAQSRKLGIRTHRRGTVAVIQGPRFSTRAESQWFSRQGWSLINMTQYPECSIARELGICYTALAMITDYAAGIRRRTTFESHTSMQPMLDTFHRNVSTLTNLLTATVPHLPLQGICRCNQPLPPEYYKQQHPAPRGTE